MHVAPGNAAGLARHNDRLQRGPVNREHAGLIHKLMLPMTTEFPRTTLFSMMTVFPMTTAFAMTTVFAQMLWKFLCARIVLHRLRCIQNPVKTPCASIMLDSICKTLHICLDDWLLELPMLNFLNHCVEKIYLLNWNFCVEDFWTSQSAWCGRLFKHTTVWKRSFDYLFQGVKRVLRHWKTSL